MMSDDTKASIFGFVVWAIWMGAYAWFFTHGHAFAMSILAATGTASLAVGLWFAVYLWWYTDA
jgi:hypothetical protein